MNANNNADLLKALTIAFIVFLISVISIPHLFLNHIKVLALVAATKIAQGYGIGTITCPNHLIFNNEQIQFQVNKSKEIGISGGTTEGKIKSSLISGFWKVGTLNLLHSTHVNLGSINDLHLSSSTLRNVSMNGIEQQDNICKNQNGNMNTHVKINDITITGRCNIKDTSVSFVSLDGKKGTFKGTIVCNALR
jgi:hypothetical protein